MARRLALVVVALALAACGGASSGPPTPTPADATPPAPTDVPSAPPATFPIPAGVTPATDEVVLRVLAVGDVVGYEPVPLTVYADGSILEPEVERFDAPGVRRLTTEGLRRLLGSVRDSGLFATSRTIEPLRPPDSGFTTYRVELHDGGRTVTVEATNFAPAPEARALIELAESILHPSGPVDPADWVDGSPAPLPYRARSTRLTSEIVAFPAGSWRRPAVEVGRLAWPLAGTPLDLGEPVAVPEAPARTIRCALVDGEDEARLRLAVEAAGAEPGAGDVLTRSWDLSVPAVPGILRLAVRPFLPEERAACDAVPLLEAPVPEPPPPPSFADVWKASRGGVGVVGTPLVRVEVFRSGTAGGPVATLAYTTGGSVLVLVDPPLPAVGVGIRSLSAAGLARLRALLADPGLPSVDLEERAADGVQDFTSFQIEGLLGGEWRSAAVTDWQPSREASAVIALARALVDPDRWAGSDGWLGGDATIHAWRPDRIQLLVERYPDVATASHEPSASRVRWPLDGTLEERRCEVLEFEEADQLVLALAAAGVDGTGGPLGGEYSLAASAPDTLVTVALTVLQPGEEDSCGALGF